MTDVKAVTAMSKVYLAGGMRTGWREKVKAAYPAFQWLDPTTHGLEDSRAYTMWDLDAIREADIVFGYLEATNPVGYNLAFELGFAVAWGTPVIFVDEKHAGNPRPCSMLRHRTHSCETLEQGIALLGTSPGPGWPPIAP